jgi:hypothetical protein
MGIADEEDTASMEEIGVVVDVGAAAGAEVEVGAEESVIVDSSSEVE